MNQTTLKMRKCVLGGAHTTTHIHPHKIRISEQAVRQNVVLVF